MNENQEKITALEKEKTELLQKLKNAVGGNSETHRKRIQELEHQLTLLNRKVSI